MKAFRTYKIDDHILRCTVDFISDDSDWENDPELGAALDRYSVFLSAAVEYFTCDLDDPVRFAVSAHPNIPLELVLQEASYFIQTLKTMYQL